MESKKYRKFLETQAEKNPVNIEESSGSKGFKITWDPRRDQPAHGRPSDILDSLYLGKTMEETVVMDRRAARMIQERLNGLEEQNIYMRRRIKMLKVATGVLAIALFFVSIILLSLHLPQLRITL